MKKGMACLLIVITTIFLSACGVNYPNDGYYYKGVRTRISDAIVLYPIPNKDRRVYISVKNKSGVASLNNVKSMIVKRLKGYGYTFVSTPSRAAYRLYLTIIYAGVVTMQEAADVLTQGYRGSIMPSGEPIVGKKVYDETRVSDVKAYILVSDLHITSTNEVIQGTTVTPQFNQRIVNTYSKFFYLPVSFNSIQPAFSMSLANQVERAF
jgi:hypothetical protein